jgi:hypothetical protein
MLKSNADSFCKENDGLASCKRSRYSASRCLGKPESIAEFDGHLKQAVDTESSSSQNNLIC